VLGYVAKEISIRLFTVSFYLRFMKIIELEMLFLMAEYLKLMYTGIQALEIAYEKASELEPEKKEEYKIFRNAFEAKLTEMGNDWVSRLKSKLPYKTEYGTMKEAIRHLDSLRPKKND
jgi:hypothetical protein